MDKVGSNSANSAGKSAFKLLKLPSFEVICWKLTKMYGRAKTIQTTYV